MSGGYRGLRDEVLQQQATELLATTHLPVGQIAERLGFVEPAAFIRAFQRMSGWTPGQFRLTLPIKSDLNGKNRRGLLQGLIQRNA